MLVPVRDKSRFMQSISSHYSTFPFGVMNEEKVEITMLAMYVLAMSEQPMMSEQTVLWSDKLQVAIKNLLWIN